MDLGPIRFKLASPEGEGWSPDLIAKVEKAYRMFLVLAVTHPDALLAPTTLVDTMWHYHILDTHKYQDDCQKFLGQFLHHFPYFGMRGEEDKIDLETAGKATADLYLKEFDFDVTSLKSEASLCGPENCDPSCTKRVGTEFNWTRPTA
jgi:hypothetical protein